MATKKKLLQAAAGNAGGASLNVEEVFSTYLYTGNGSTQTITNGIDLDGEGGLVWAKCRSLAEAHMLFDTERGIHKRIFSNSTNAESTSTNTLTAFNSDGFSIGDNNIFNTNNSTNVAWTWRKAPKFFDVVTYTGDGNNNRQISHNLDATVGCMIIKRTDTTKNWRVYHRAADASPEDGYLSLNSTAAWYDELANGLSQNQSKWWYTAPTSTNFTVSSDVDVNASGGTYVAYLFAHNDGDGEFGPDSDADIIKCGSYTGTGSAGNEVDLGFEPQWVMIKRTDSADDWELYDTMRGMAYSTNGDMRLIVNTSSAEGDVTTMSPTASGFVLEAGGGSYNANNGNYIYIAIRRGPMAVPESATDVFHIDNQSTSISEAPRYRSGFVTDFYFWKEKHTSTDWTASTRLLGTNLLKPNLTNTEISSSIYTWDFMEGALNVTSAASNKPAWMWKRAPNFFDVVAYEGNSTIKTVNHNLGVEPEMMWIKNRGSPNDWTIYHKDLGAVKRLRLNNTTAAGNEATAFNSTAPTSSVFTVGTSDNTNENPFDFIAYLFASLDGISKVGSYTGDGTTGRVINCGFTSGARFVMTKRTNTTGNWNVWDTERGIVAGNDPRLELNSTLSEHNPQDYIDPDNSGFIVNYVADNLDDTNVDGDEYIFYAIA